MLDFCRFSLYISPVFIITNYNSFVATESNDFKVELIQALFRHGDRTIDKTETYPKDPYNASDYEPYGYGELTNKGKRCEYGIGKMIRKRYGKFLGERYESDEVYGYSTDQDRTKMSLQLVLAGIYPPTPELTWHENINWIPIPTKYNPRKFDFLSTFTQCPEYGLLYRQTVSLPEVQLKFRQYMYFLEYLANNTGLEVSPGSALFVYSAFRSQMSLGLTLPNWCTEDVFGQLVEITSSAYDILTYTNALTKLAVGPTIKRFLNNINANELKKSKRKMYLYSAHDTNIISFIRAHNITTPRIADYGSTLLFEKLRGKDKRVYIRLLLWTPYANKLTTLKLAKCNEVCPLSEYLRLIDPIIPASNGTECLYGQAYQSVIDLIDGDVNNDKVNDLRLNFT